MKPWMQVLKRVVSCLFFSGITICALISFLHHIVIADQIRSSFVSFMGGVPYTKLYVISTLALAQLYIGAYFGYKAFRSAFPKSASFEN